MDGNFLAHDVKKAITYFYSLAYCPPGELEDFLVETSGLKADLPEGVEIEVASRMVSFHNAERDPDQELVHRLENAIRGASEDIEGLNIYQAQMDDVYTRPGRAKAENRLHRKKGCKFCEAPCAYGFFSLVSEPRFDLLQHLLDAEREKAPEEKSAVRPVWSYTVTHLAGVMGTTRGFISPYHLGHLSFCLLMLSMAKSRYPLPEEQVKAFQARNQRMIASYERS